MIKIDKHITGIGFWIDSKYNIIKKGINGVRHIAVKLL
jgi:hypothetical protein